MNAGLLVALALAATSSWRADAPSTTEVDLPRFRIHTTQAASGTTRLLAKELEPSRDFIAGRLGGDWPGLVEVRVGEGHDELVRLDPPGETPPAWAAGLAHPGESLILFDAAALRRDGGIGVIRHELAHAALGALAGAPLPRWFHEGFAVLAAGEWGSQSALAMVRAARDPIPLRALEQGFPDSYGDVELAYAESASFVEYLFAHHGTAAVRKLITLVHDGQSFDEAFTAAIGPRDQVEAAWLSSIRVRYTWFPVVTGSTTLFTAIALLCLAAWARVRRGRKARLAELALEEQALAAAERIRVAEQTALEQPAPAEPAAVVNGPNKPTLH